MHGKTEKGETEIMQKKKHQPDIRVDKEKLKEAIKKSGKSLRKASIEMGYGENYLGKAGKQGKLTKASMNLLTALYGIKVADIEATEKPAEQEQEKPAKPVKAKEEKVVDQSPSEESIMNELKMMNTTLTAELKKTNETLVSIAKLIGMTIRILK